MTVSLKISDAAGDWLYKAIDKALCKVQSNPTQHSAELLLLLEELLADIHQAISPEPVTKTTKTTTKTKTKNGEKLTTVAPKLCPQHPTYGAIRSPKTDCEQCWGAYTRLNPLRATQARRKYDREHRHQSG